MNVASSNWNKVYTSVNNTSGNWDKVYTAVNLTSSNWDDAYTAINLNSGLWASNVDAGVRALSSNWESTYNTFKTASSTFLTSETDSQTLSFDEITKNLSITNGNTISLSALTDTTAIDTGVRALTGNWQNTYSNYSTNSAAYVKTVTTTTPGISAVTNIIAVSALPVSPDPNILYIVI